MINDEISTRLIDASNILPIGSNLRPLVGHSDITIATLKKVLSERGLAIANADKSSICDLMEQLILTPEEFSFLLNKLKTREESPKQLKDDLTLNSDIAFADLIDAGALNLTQASEDPYGNYSLAHHPSGVITKKDGLESIKFEYTIHRRSISSDYIQGLRAFGGTIEISRKTDSKEITIKTNYSCKETKVINKVALKKFKKNLKKLQIIDDTKTDKIRFGSFDNKGRINFLLNCTNCDNHTKFKFKKITDLELKPDDKLKISDIKTLAWLKNKVSKIKLTGSALEETFFFTDPDCHEYLKIWRLDCGYEFDHAHGTGTFKVVYDFDNYGRSAKDSCVFQLAISEVKNPPFHAGTNEYKDFYNQLSKNINDSKDASFLKHQL